jgi:hypothetical protein
VEAHKNGKLSMRKLWIIAFVCISFGTLGASAALAENVVVGVNVVGVDQLSEVQQGALIEQATGRLLGLSDLNNPKDLEGHAIASGYLRYLQVMVALKDVRDPSRLRGALQQLATQGRLAGSLYYSWTGHPGEVGSTIFRCGDLTDAGKLALSPM